MLVLQSTAESCTFFCRLFTAFAVFSHRDTKPYTQTHTKKHRHTPRHAHRHTRILWHSIQTRRYNTSRVRDTMSATPPRPRKSFSTPPPPGFFHNFFWFISHTGTILVSVADGDRCGFHLVAFCLRALPGPPKVPLPILFQPPALTSGDVVPSSRLQRVL